MIGYWVWRNIHWVQPPALVFHTQLMPMMNAVSDKTTFLQEKSTHDEYRFGLSRIIMLMYILFLSLQGSDWSGLVWVVQITSHESLSLLTNTGNTDLVLQHVLLLLRFSVSIMRHLGCPLRRPRCPWYCVIRALLFPNKFPKNVQRPTVQPTFPHCKFCYVSRCTCTR